MSDSLWQWPLDSFLEATASANATPGGGSVGAVVGALGLGLVIMGLEITARNQASGDVGASISEARTLLAQIRMHADADVRVFQEVMMAYRLPKNSDDEKAARREAIQRATVAATEKPLASARDVVTALALAERAAVVTKREVLSDTVAGLDIMMAAVKAILHNVDINLGTLADLAAAERYATERDTLSALAARHVERAKSTVSKRSVR
jgi:formiminotetrahydrofolate cyclodeaminase